MLSRRDLLKASGQSFLAVGFAPVLSAYESMTPSAKAMRSINVVNFMRGVEPRGPMDLFLPVQKQMEIMLQHNLPATWLLQFDALVTGPFVEFLKKNMPKGHEVGIWFEMNELHCKAAGVQWRGRPGYEWDHYPDVAFTIGYTHDERVKLADAFMREYKKVWGAYPKSVASWNLDSFTMAHLNENYGIDAYAVCRDQIATDGFTIWGAPIAGYYPSRTNCWSPAVDKANQLNTPVFRMLGQDPVYYFERSYPMPGGKRGHSPDTMEPVWPSGRSPEFIENFLAMIAKSPTLAFAYAQLGQENNFGWPEMADAYPRQMKALAELRASGGVQVETMGETGRKFKRAFNQTPSQAQVMLDDPFGNTDHKEGSIWFQSRFYRANLHLKSDLPYLRDLTVYADRYPQPYLDEATRLHDVEQRMLAVLDGFHWSKNPGSPEPGAGAYFIVEGAERLRLTGRPTVREEGASMVVELPVTGNRKLIVRFDERSLTVEIKPKARLALSFEFERKKSALYEVVREWVAYRWHDVDYGVKTRPGAVSSEAGWMCSSGEGKIELDLGQAPNRRHSSAGFQPVLDANPAPYGLGMPSPPTPSPLTNHKGEGATD